MDDFDERNHFDQANRGNSAISLSEEQAVEWEPEYKCKKIFFKECNIAGMSFHVEKDDELWNELEEGTKLALIRDRNNKHDVNAVAVALAGDYDGDPDNFDFKFILGYVPRTENAELAAMMDAGYSDKFSAVIKTYRRFGNYNDRIRITIYIESFKPELIRPNLLRAESITTSDLYFLLTALKSVGTACLSLAVNPDQEDQMPIEGEKIVLLYHGKDKELLYLVRVQSKLKDSDLENIDPLYDNDDYVHFSVANIMGPITIDKTRHEFLKGINSEGFSATRYLNKRLSDGFYSIFESVFENIISCNDVDNDTIE